ncbi:MAG: hypothetical protein ACRD0F_08470, partial [Acidimicrobiales bacterium]
MPAGALAGNVALSALGVAPEALPAPPAGVTLAGGGVFGPHGLRFRSPATISLALNRPEAAGSVLHLYYFEESARRWDDLGARATVDVSGTVARAAVDHFSTYAVGQEAGFDCRYDHTRYFADQASAEAYARNVEGISSPDAHYHAEVAGPLDTAIYGSANWAVNVTLCRRRAAPE